MSPKPKDIPHTAPPLVEGQGSMFAEEIVGSGSTELMDRTITTRLEPVSEGIYPESTESLLPPAEVVEATRKAAITENRRRAQRGKHSPVEASGTYLTLRPGDYLPGFGPVTYTNLTRAEEHAGRLEAKRRSGQR